ncbi:MAG: aldo/keto reductase [Gammaproteobacteria bacterium]|nr:aldo/keto reductase [Gammaproteobacteria bacterium]MYD03159.1 aldo/keto reductase [Gammaproteobacteria bacterium]MYI25782.1 aldo/keto reductase [Gammaproteobacteria bacterium]
MQRANARAIHRGLRVSRRLPVACTRGFRYYDTAPHYGQGLSERRVGDALRRFRGREYVLSTKVGRLLKPSGYAEERHNPRREKRRAVSDRNGRRVPSHGRVARRRRRLGNRPGRK